MVSKRYVDMAVKAAYVQGRRDGMKAAAQIDAKTLKAIKQQYTKAKRILDKLESAQIAKGVATGKLPVQKFEVLIREILNAVELDSVAKVAYKLAKEANSNVPNLISSGTGNLEQALALYKSGKHKEALGPMHWGWGELYDYLGTWQDLFYWSRL